MFIDTQKSYWDITSINLTMERMSINLFSNDTLLLLCSASRLKSQSCDEDVDKNSKEHKNSRCVIQSVKSRLFLNIIQVILHWREQEQTHQRYINDTTAEYVQRKTNQ